MRFFEKGPQTKIKVCGITTPSDAQAIVESGVDAIGINHWPRSKRYIAPDQSASWLGELAGAVTRIGLFVNASLDEIEAAVDHCVLDALQLHGDESPEFCEEVAAFGLPVIKAIGVKDEAPVVDPQSYPTPLILLDAYAPQEYGGTGRAFRWEIAREVMAELPEPDGFLILAGGLTPENVAEAVRVVGPNAVDIASGVESEPGVKDLAKVEALVQAVRP